VAFEVRTRLRGEVGKVNPEHQRVYDAVQAYMRSHRFSCPTSACRDLGLKAWVYFNARNRIELLAKRKRLAADPFSEDWDVDDQPIQENVLKRQSIPLLRSDDPNFHKRDSVGGRGGKEGQAPYFLVEL